MKKHIFLAGILVMLLSSCSDFLDYNENSDYDQNKLFNTTWSNTDFVTGIYAYLPGALNDVDGALRSAACDEAEYVWPTSTIHRFYDGSWSAIRTVDDKWGITIKPSGLAMTTWKMVRARTGKSLSLRKTMPR